MMMMMMFDCFTASKRSWARYELAGMRHKVLEKAWTVSVDNSTKSKNFMNLEDPFKNLSERNGTSTSSNAMYKAMRWARRCGPTCSWRKKRSSAIRHEFRTSAYGRLDGRHALLIVGFNHTEDRREVLSPSYFTMSAMSSNDPSKHSRKA